MCDNYSFYTTSVGHFSPLFIKPMFNSDSYSMHKVRVTLYIFASIRALLLDLVPSRSSSDFIKMFKRFVSQRGVNWVTNMALSPMVYERLLRSTKELCGKC